MPSSLDGPDSEGSCDWGEGEPGCRGRAHARPGALREPLPEPVPPVWVGVRLRGPAFGPLAEPVCVAAPASGTRSCVGMRPRPAPQFLRVAHEGPVLTEAGWASGWRPGPRLVGTPRRTFRAAASCAGPELVPACTWKLPRHRTLRPQRLPRARCLPRFPAAGVVLRGAHLRLARGRCPWPSSASSPALLTSARCHLPRSYCRLRAYGYSKDSPPCPGSKGRRRRR